MNVKPKRIKLRRGEALAHDERDAQNERNDSGVDVRMSLRRQEQQKKLRKQLELKDQEQ